MKKMVIILAFLAMIASLSFHKRIRSHDTYSQKAQNYYQTSVSALHHLKNTLTNAYNRYWQSNTRTQLPSILDVTPLEPLLRREDDNVTYSATISQWIGEIEKAHAIEQRLHKNIINNAQLTINNINKYSQEYSTEKIIALINYRVMHEYKRNDSTIHYALLDIFNTLPKELLSKKLMIASSNPVEQFTHTLVATTRTVLDRYKKYKENDPIATDSAHALSLLLALLDILLPLTKDSVQDSTFTNTQTTNIFTDYATLLSELQQHNINAFQEPTSSCKVAPRTTLETLGDYILNAKHRIRCLMQQYGPFRLRATITTNTDAIKPKKDV